MKFEFLSQANSKKLKLFVSGWGMDARPFAGLTCKDDLMMAYDFTSLLFDKELFEKYESVEIYGWSFGVWMAGYLADKLPNVTKKVAINGTLKPIDDTFGIQKAIFDGTLEGLSEEGLQKFNARMCGKNVYEKPNRTLLSLKEELKALQNHFDTPIHVEFDEAYVGKKDRVIPYKNQLNFWGEKAKLEDIYHFDRDFFEKVING